MHFASMPIKASIQLNLAPLVSHAFRLPRHLLPTLLPLSSLRGLLVARKLRKLRRPLTGLEAIAYPS